MGNNDDKICVRSCRSCIFFIFITCLSVRPIVIMIGDTILIIFISIATALLGEGQFICCRKKMKLLFNCLIHLALTWLLVYRTEKYQRLKGEVERASKRSKSKVFCSNFTIYFVLLIIQLNVKRKLLVKQQTKYKNENLVYRFQISKDFCIYIHIFILTSERQEEKLKVNNRDLSMVRTILLNKISS